MTAGKSAEAVESIIFLCLCTQLACIVRGQVGRLVRSKSFWSASVFAALLGSVLLAMASHADQIGVARSLIALLIFGMLLIYPWKQKDRRPWITSAIVTILLVGFARELLRTETALHWFALPKTDWPLISAVCGFIGSWGSTIALVYIAGSTMAARYEELCTCYERMRQLVNSTDHGICEVNEAGLLTFANVTASEMLAIGDEGLSSVWIQDKLEADEDECSARAISEFTLRPTTPVGQTKARIARSNQPPVNVEWSSSPILRDGKPTGAIVTLHDISERESADRFVHFRTELLEMIARNKSVEEVSKMLVAAVEERLEGYHCSILVCDIEGFRVFASPGLPEGFRSAMNTVPCNRMFQTSDRKGSTALKNWDDALRSISSTYEFSGTWTEAMVSTANELLGTVMLNHPVIAPLERSHGRILREAARLGALAVEHRWAYERLLHQGYHDALTGLPNRLLLADRLNQALARAERASLQVAYFSIDLDRFKEINDTLGHDAGDLFLQQISVRLASGIRASDTLARTGGDEFTLILPDIQDLHDAARVAESLVTSLHDPFDVENHTVYGSASIGMAVYPQDGRDADTLQRNADRAMYKAKAKGRNLVQYYSGEDSLEDDNGIEIEHQLRRAIEQGNFSLHFQPQFTCERRLVGFEALLRFQHPKLGMVPASRFVPMAEESGLILPIGEWVLHEVCRQILEWQEKGLRVVRVAINVSPLQLARGDFSETVARVLRATGVKPELLELELTEGVLMSSVHDSAKQIAEMARLGVRLSVDDFGTGYSCLSYLHQLPLHAVKIDRSFVARMLDPDGPRCIVEAIISLARQLHLQTIAEGVETEEQLALLQAVGCDLVQGFVFSKPLSAIDASCLLWKEMASEPSASLALSTLSGELRTSGAHGRPAAALTMGRRQRCP